MDTRSIISEGKELLGKLDFPAAKQDIVQHAKQSGASSDIVSQLEQLPEQKFGSVEEVLKKLPLGGVEGEVEKLL